MYYLNSLTVKEPQQPEKFLKTQNLIGFPVASESFTTQIDTMLSWARQRLSKVVCVANVHMLVEAKHHSHFAKVLHKADLLTPDGMPLAWLMGWLSKCRQDRVAGMDIMLSLCQRAHEEGVSLFFLGATPDILQQMEQRLKQEFPDVPIAGMEALPFRPLTPGEDKALVKQLNESGAGLVLISLGCPKQEQWMHTHKGKIKAVMIGLGGVFPIYAGEKKWAPAWVRKGGLEWLYRLIQEPRRLWRRYASTIPLFLWLAFKQVIKVQVGMNPDAPFREQWIRIGGNG
ncbi:MAG: WecB/TagA/CpsF family glycosyltransferase [Cyanothece sp. SIO1E1]|nr:WecB/TagA/CpsF family glycosyltransferase [Cyanothece sp. SIO1E1]